MLKAVLFDMGGTLIHFAGDDLQMYRHSFQEALERAAYDFSELEIADLLEELNREQLKRASLYPESATTLSALTDLGVQLGLVSNIPFPGDLLARTLSAFDIRKYFEVVVSSSDVGFRKPHPDIFLSALEAMNVDAADALYVGDAPDKDVAGAHTVGMKAAWINRKAEENPMTLPDYEIAS